jgi:hypothetical protein
VEGAEWARYRAWNSAIAEDLFGSAVAGTPVYLDLEDDVLARLSERTGRLGPTGADDLSYAVRSTLDITRGPGDVFRAHRRLLGAWLATSEGGEPPILALLAVLSLAAESMAAGEGMAAHNYYGRLARLLGITDEGAVQRLISGYRAIAEDLWEALNSWLDSLEGARGTPTAYVVGAHRYIGLPLSQALVRAEDRRRFRSLFAAAALSPGEVIGMTAMERILDGWISQEPSPASGNLRRLWARNDDVRERIAQVAAIELEAWNGDDAVVAADHEVARRPASRLTAVVRTFLARQLELGVEVQLASRETRELEVLAARSNEVLLTCLALPASDRWLRVEDAGAIAPISLLGAPITLRDTLSQTVIVHEPRSLYVFVKDESTQAFIEHERVVLGADLLLLVTDGLAPAVGTAISTIARPGHRIWTAATMPGLPNGWALISGVQLMAGPPEADRGLYARELNALLPVALTQLTIAGGLGLPGLVRRWSSLRPPEIRATNEGERRLVVAVTPVRTPNVPPPTALEASEEGGAVVLALTRFGLPDGDYEVTAHAEGGDAAPRRRTLRLRSADSPTLPMAGELPLVHVLDRGQLWPLSATGNTDASAATIQGGIVAGGESLADDDRWRPRIPRWDPSERRAALPTHSSPAVTLEPIPSDSCVITGAHFMVLPYVGPGARHSATITGVCRNCGLVKRYPATWGALVRGRNAPGPVRPRPARAALTLPPVDPEAPVTADAVLDAVFHLGHGPIRHLEQLAHQLEPSAAFAASFIRALEAFGHVEIGRSPDRLRPESWQATPTTLVEISGGRFLIVGFVSRLVLEHLASAVQGLGGEMTTEADSFGLPRRILVGLERSGIAEVAKAVASDFRLPIHVSLDAAERLASLLPPLSRALAALPTAPVPQYRHAQIFDLGTARWREVRRLDAPGGYRFEGYTVSYGLRSAREVRGEGMRVADFSLARFGAAAIAGESLARSGEEGTSIDLPMGADLPGLYARVAVLASGQGATPSKDRPLVRYRGMPAKIVLGILRKLEG